MFLEIISEFLLILAVTTKLNCPVFMMSVIGRELSAQ